ncbi:hypothetical protein [Streptomyces indicus]|uniref:Uncharacterized protein n=1 Tax=Streptomyces indicus TaxID=417292 RepID=A0A1G9CMZ7_9ACTN|nr:hypothetical protein [Streptomyces indicus]SDK53061.1 hypothetical protein SAMN05421806_108219 [Streptomyces indicus]
MSAWHTTGLRAATAAGLALSVAVGVAGTATADVKDPSYDWGTVVETPDGVQANAWVAGVTGVGRIVNARLFEAASPGTPKAPREMEGGNELVNLTAPTPVGKVGLGKVSALYAKALTNKLPVSKSSKTTMPVPGAAYANAGGGSVDIGLPYVESNVFAGTALTGFGVHVDAIDVHARSLPGRPVEFQGGAASGKITLFGTTVVEIPPIWAVNLGATIPATGDDAAPIIAQTNEQITTDNKGVPTKGKNGSYQYDPRATSGYVNAIHASVLGPNVADVTIGHAAVIRDPAKTDMLKDKLPKKLPSLLDMVTTDGTKLPTGEDLAVKPQMPSVEAPAVAPAQ